jgi:MinD-like ATPase involved in chromosome partitioning or flagellar assembly
MASIRVEVLQQVWVKAFERGEVTLTFKTEAAMQRVRMALYNAARATGASYEVADAKQNCELQIVDKLTIKVVRADMSEDVKTIAEQLGIEVPQPMSEVSKAALAFAERMRKEEPPKLSERAQELADKYRGKS